MEGNLPVVTTSELFHCVNLGRVMSRPKAPDWRISLFTREVLEPLRLIGGESGVAAEQMLLARIEGAGAGIGW